MSPLLVAALVVFLEGLSFGIILPVLTPFTEKLGGNAVWAGILFAAATLPRVLTAPAWGRFSDRFGRRPAMTVVALGTTSASILWAFCTQLDGVLVSGLVWLLISRTVYGLFAAQSVLGMAVASDVSTPARRASAMGALGAAFGLAFTIGPILGGYFAKHIGLAEVGWLAGGLQAASVLLIFTMLRETRPTAAPIPGGAPAYPKGWAYLVSIPAVAHLLLVTAVSTAAYSVLFPTFPTLTEAWYGWDTQETGKALSVFGLIGAIVQGGMIRPAVKRLGERAVAILGLTTLAAGLLGMATQPALGGMWASLALVAVGTGFCVPTITGLMSLSVHERDQGAVHGLNQSATAIGRTVGFAASGLLLFRFGATYTYGVAAIAAAASLILLGFVRFNPASADSAIEATADEIP